MSRDRLREARAQQGFQQPQQGYAPQQQQQQYNGGGYQQQQQQQYAPPPQQQQQYPPPQAHQSYELQPQRNGAPNDMSSFFAEVSSIQDEIKHLQSNINDVSELHSRRLATTDDHQQADSAARLAQLTAQTQGVTNSVRTRILRLNDENKRSAKGDPDFKTRKLQIGTLQNSFKRALEEYNQVEKKSRDKYRQRMERQIRIVKPDATQEEIRAAFDDSQGGQQIFSQALVQSRQSGARAAFAEVQTRNQDLRKIEETITELAQMMQDMATLVLEQDDSVQAIEQSAVQANTDVEAGLQQTQKAVKSARAARRKRWLCFIIVLIICIVVAVAVGVTVSNNVKKHNNDNNN